MSLDKKLRCDIHVLLCSSIHSNESNDRLCLYVPSCCMLVTQAMLAMWLSGKRELLLANLRILFELLQMTGVLIGMGSFEPQWLVVRNLFSCVQNSYLKLQNVFNFSSAPGHNICAVWSCCWCWVQRVHMGTVGLYFW